MIFVTTGTQLPFDRLVLSVDEAAADLSETVFAQIGAKGREPKNIEYARLLTPQEFDKRLLSARVLVAHAGIGTILSVMKAKKPLVIMPRLASLNEHRNDHQIATANQMSRLPGIYVAHNSRDVIEILKRSDLKCLSDEFSSNSRETLVDNIKNVISNGF
ncbi:glycosyltransferase [Asticcacaulis excentricus]|uniref:Glycosyltransferase 28 domain protein n=1 Tax=Asticcacaulis excentricus (strain ATCC 15261 / DSM 4724 / KCTC 12464 / NCIMB 9791 / VKM B-1370 / CB 48) TaxID=573065 RepID=E8RMB3_ASTEC|nr:glycosyltransferase [Asticcacaulis excentricus]ADU13864.1 Glycosyltransferase 28 domain protein [Asticcacaulis excentricus CB 48]